MILYLLLPPHHSHHYLHQYPFSMPRVLPIMFVMPCSNVPIDVSVQSDVASHVGYVAVQLIFPYPCLKFVPALVSLPQWGQQRRVCCCCCAVLFTTTMKFFYPPHLPHWIILYSEYFPRAVRTFLPNPNSFYMPCVIWQLTFVPRQWFIT